MLGLDLVMWMYAAAVGMLTLHACLYVRAHTPIHAAMYMAYTLVCCQGSMPFNGRTMHETHEVNKWLVCVVQVSTLKQQELPEIWVAAGEGCSFLDKYSYVLSELPSKGELFSEQDRTDIRVICTRMHCIARGLLRELV